MCEHLTCAQDLGFLMLCWQQANFFLSRFLAWVAPRLGWTS